MVNKRNKVLTFIDLFAGIGGFHHALKSLGGKCVLSCELDKECQRVYQSSFGKTGYQLVSNIREITRNNIEDENSLKTPRQISKLVPDHDVLCGGFPCTTYSKSGAQKGVRDKTKGTLFYDILQIIEAKKPKYVFLENVRNLAGPRHIHSWKTIIGSLDELGYNVHSVPLIFSPHLLSRKLGGTCQVRERVFIIAIRKGESKKPILDIVTFNEKLRKKVYFDPDKWDVKDFLQKDKDIQNIDKYLLPESEKTYLEAWNYLVENITLDNLPGFPIWAFAFRSKPTLRGDMHDWEINILKKNAQFYRDNKVFLDKWMLMKWGKKKLRVSDFPSSRQKLEWQARKTHPMKKNRTLKDLVIQFRPSGIRVKPPTYLPALVAITQTSVVGPNLRGSVTPTFRKLTPVEASRLQGFPDNTVANAGINDANAYKQFGNAVNVGIVRYVLRILLNR